MLFLENYIDINCTVIDKGDSMANKNHDLDEKIIQSAIQEFTIYGFKNASLRKIAANANVTIGAIYTRYKTKDDLFCSLLQPLLTKIETAFQIIKKNYQDNVFKNFSFSIQKEYEIILDLLFDEYSYAYLLLCKSQGSRLEHFFDDIIERKIKETKYFFEQMHIHGINPFVLKWLITSQFQLYFQIFKEGYDRAVAKSIIHDVMIYHQAGWEKLLQLS